MPLSDIEGQPRALAALRAAIARGSIAHAYLFAGPEGVGKEKAARALAQALICPVQPGAGCGQCAACGRVLRGNHPDVLLLASEETQVSSGVLARGDLGRAPSRDIRVDQVRKLLEQLVRRPLEASRRVILVLGADALNDASQNALLKTLEEPPADNVLLLVTSSPHLLLPTLRSRLVLIPFGPLNEDWVARQLTEVHGRPREMAEEAARLADGSMGAALSLDAKALKEREEVVVGFETLQRGDARPLLRFAEARGASRGEAETTLLALLGWNEAVARVKGGASAAGVLASLAQEVAGRTPAEVLHIRHQAFTKTLETIRDRNGAPRLQLEGMLLELLA